MFECELAVTGLNKAYNNVDFALKGTYMLIITEVVVMLIIMIMLIMMITVLIKIVH